MLAHLVQSSHYLQINHKYQKHNHEADVLPLAAAQPYEVNIHLALVSLRGLDQTLNMALHSRNQLADLCAWSTKRALSSTLISNTPSGNTSKARSSPTSPRILAHIQSPTDRRTTTRKSPCSTPSKLETSPTDASR